MSILADRQYTLNNYKQLEKLNISQELHDEIIQKIKKDKLKIGLVNVCSLDAKNKDINKKESVNEG